MQNQKPIKNKTLLFCIIGKSGTGKDSILRGLKSLNLPVKYLIPTTTRQSRTGEKNGSDYWFKTLDEFREMSLNGAFADILTVNVYDKGTDNTNVSYYGYPRPIENEASILLCPWKIFLNIKKSESAHGYTTIPIYVDVDSVERLYRLIIRETNNTNHKYKEVARRFVADEEDFPNTNIIKTIIADCNGLYLYNQDLDISIKSTANFIERTMLDYKMDKWRISRHGM